MAILVKYVALVSYGRSGHMRICTASPAGADGMDIQGGRLVCRKRAFSRVLLLLLVLREAAAACSRSRRELIMYVHVLIALLYLVRFMCFRF